MIFDKVFFKFILIGFINTILGICIMFVMYNVFNMGYWVSSAMNYFVGTIISFFMNKYFTFEVKEWTLFMVAAFIGNILLCYFIAFGIARPLAGYLLKASQLKIRENIALFTGMCIYTGLNYLGQRLVVFKTKKK